MDQGHFRTREAYFGISRIGRFGEAHAEPRRRAKAPKIEAKKIMWVLVVILYAFGPGTSSVAMHDFSSQAACEKARDFASQAEGGSIHVKALCTPK